MEVSIKISEKAIGRFAAILGDYIGGPDEAGARSAERLIEEAIREQPAILRALLSHPEADSDAGWDANP